MRRIVTPKLLVSSHYGRSFCAGPVHVSDEPATIFQLVSVSKIDEAIKLCEKFAKSVNLTPREFLSKQCSERSYLIYRLSAESRVAALELSHSGESFPVSITASELLTDPAVWPAEVKEQYERVLNCLNLSRVSLSLGSPSAARDYQIIGKSIVWKLLFGRTACVLQTFMSRRLQACPRPHEFALANHKKAARLFDDQLGGPGPKGPLEAPEEDHTVDEFRVWSEKRVEASRQHIRLVSHLVSDVAKEVLARSEAKPFLDAAETILLENEFDANEIKYLTGVIRATRKSV